MPGRSVVYDFPLIALLLKPKPGVSKGAIRLRCRSYEFNSIPLLKERPSARGANECDVCVGVPLMISARTLRISARELVRLLRAEIVSANNQPELNLTISKEHRRKGDFRQGTFTPNGEPDFDFVSEFALLTIEPRRERDAWILKIEVETPIGRRSHYDEYGLKRRDLTLDEFEEELRDPMMKRVAVRLATESAAAREHFDQWLAEMRTHHPRRSLKSRVGSRHRSSGGRR